MPQITASRFDLGRGWRPHASMPAIGILVIRHATIVCRIGVTSYYVAIVQRGIFYVNVVTSKLYHVHHLMLSSSPESPVS